ncbi:four helix bundle protein [Patescibacteria group bacterium]
MVVENLNVYKRLSKLVITVLNITITFPKYEMYELGSQLRRSSNSIPANIAEGFGNKHTNIYTESISRAQGELRETIHHLRIAFRKGYVKKSKLIELVNEYTECSRMLYCLEKSLILKIK